ncbi:MAG TPA: CSLREA domain-containing protein, partial [Chloroflexaceae bacterium]|nr:CSLREA domain-containing protein [Chloroflexaceae bacterium]
MPRLSRQLSLAVLLALLLTAIPAARPGLAQAGITVSNLTDVDNGVADGCGPDGCSLREAIRLANSRPGPNTITFSLAGEITPLSPLPPLSDDGTTIDGGSRTVSLNGSSAGEANGIEIRSSGNTVRGLVIYNFTGSDRFAAGAGIYIDGAPFGGRPAGGDNNR